MCPSRRLTQTGLSGVTASIQSFRGSSTGLNCWWSQSPMSTQRPGRSSRAVAVDEGGEDERPVEVDELRPGRGELSDLFRRPDGEDLIAADGHGLGPGPAGVARPNFSLPPSEVDPVS